MPPTGTTSPLFPIDLNQLAQQVIDLTRPRWKDVPQERGIVIDVRTDPQDDLPVVEGIESVGESDAGE